MPGYISVVIMEWLLVLYVRMGVQKRGMRLRDLVGGRWATPKEVMKDIALGAGLWAVWIGLMNADLLGGELTLRRGFCPEGFSRAWRGYQWRCQRGFVRKSHFVAIFRGNFRRSLVALDGRSSSRLWYSASAICTKESAQVARITLFGVLFGLLALWRKSLRPGMVTHAWSDIFGVIIFRGA